MSAVLGTALCYIQGRQKRVRNWQKETEWGEKMEKKKRLLEISGVCGIRSVGRIAAEIAQDYEAQGWECKIAYGRLDVPEKYRKYAVRIGNKANLAVHGVASMLFDRQGLASKRATKAFLRWADDYNPDLLWLHVIHGYYINYEMLFRWIKSRPEMKVYWTFHDCWAFTGHCCYFSAENCEKWKSGCHHCPLLKRYPSCYGLDNSENNYARKKAAFTGVKDMTIICPSEWIAKLTKQSFLSEYPVEVRHNKIDLSAFTHTEGSFLSDYHLEGKKIILGVASSWDWRKGLRDYIALSKLLSHEYAVIVVGLFEKQIRQIRKDLPEHEFVQESSNVFRYRSDHSADLLCLTKTNNVQELAELYSISSVYANLSYEENYPTTNLEATACGTPVVTYRTGGSPESCRPENVVEQGNLEELIAVIKRICE